MQNIVIGIFTKILQKREEEMQAISVLFFGKIHQEFFFRNTHCCFNGFSAKAFILNEIFSQGRLQYKVPQR